MIAFDSVRGLGRRAGRTIPAAAADSVAASAADEFGAIAAGIVPEIETSFGSE